MKTEEALSETSEISVELLREMSYNKRKMLISQNNFYKSTFPPIKKEMKKFNLSKTPPGGITFKKSLKIFPGNYCYPLKENYISTKEKTFFYRYYGEEKIEEVTKKVSSNTVLYDEIPDDFFSNLIFLYIIKHHTSIDEIKKNLLHEFPWIKKISQKNIKKRVKKLYDRYHYLVPNNTRKFFHMSCVEEEMKNYESLIATNKQIYCGLCFKYDCNFHNTPDCYFDDQSCYNVKEYLQTYKKMIELISVPQDKEIFEESFNNKAKYEEKEEDLKDFQEFFKEESVKRGKNYHSQFQEEEFLLKQSEKQLKNNLRSKNRHSPITEVPIEEEIPKKDDGNFCSLVAYSKRGYNNFLNMHKLHNICGSISKKPNNAVTTMAKQNSTSPDMINLCFECGKGCYKRFITMNQEIINEIMKYFSKGLPIVYELYLTKLLQIFKYDPCSIAKCLKLVCIESKSQGTIEGDLDCFVVFLRLLQKDFFIDRILTKDVIENYFKEKNTDKKKLIDFQFKHINENAKKNKVIPYQSCYHLGNEVCDEHCPCSARGFCEKYCACNKNLCKLKWGGCHCKGPCNSLQCPCCANSRECDFDLCLNCRGKSQCKNMKLKQRKAKLGIGNSSIVGWGLFAKEDIKKDDLIGEYIGELLDLDDLNERSEFIGLEGGTYMFTLNDDYTVDSRTMGNTLRFANHSKSRANAYAKILFADGNHRICLLASENIKKDDEIFFDYDGQNILCEKYDWINDDSCKPPNNHKKNIKPNKNAIGDFPPKKKKKSDLDKFLFDEYQNSHDNYVYDDNFKRPRKRRRSPEESLFNSQEPETLNDKDDSMQDNIQQAQTLLRDFFGNFKQTMGI